MGSGLYDCMYIYINNIAVAQSNRAEKQKDMKFEKALLRREGKFHPDFFLSFFNTRARSPP
jgi:hypothetical protein